MHQGNLDAFANSKLLTFMLLSWAVRRIGQHLPEKWCWPREDGRCHATRYLS